MGTSLAHWRQLSGKSLTCVRHVLPYKHCAVVPLKCCGLCLCTWTPQCAWTCASTILLGEREFPVLFFLGKVEKNQCIKALVLSVTCDFTHSMTSLETAQTPPLVSNCRIPVGNLKVSSVELVMGFPIASLGRGGVFGNQPTS